MSEPINSFSIRELTELLIKHLDIHEGFYVLTIKLDFSVGFVETKPKQALPSGIVGFSGVGLVKTESANHLTVDASEVNPLPKGTGTAPKKRAAPRKKQKESTTDNGS